MAIILTTRIDGLMKYQHAFQYSQKKKLLLPTIISTSSAKRFPPAKGVRNTVEGLKSSQALDVTRLNKLMRIGVLRSCRLCLGMCLQGCVLHKLSIKSVSNPQGTSFYYLYLVAWHRRLTQLQEGGGLRWRIGNFPFWSYHRRR